MNIAYKGFEDKDYVMVSNDQGEIKEREYNDNLPTILSLENDIEQLEDEKLEQMEIKEKYAKKLKFYKNGQFSKLKEFFKIFAMGEGTIIVGTLLFPIISNWLSADPVFTDVSAMNLIQISCGLSCSALVLLVSLHYTRVKYNYYSEQKLQYNVSQELIKEIELKVKQKQTKIKQLEESKSYNHNIPLESTKVNNNNELRKLSALKIALENYNQYLKYYEKGKLETKLQKMYKEEDANLINNTFRKIYKK